jgi:hypothetical protein
MNTVEKNAAIEVDKLAQHMAEIDGISYQEALKKVSAQHPKLWASYAGFVEPGAKPYGAYGAAKSYARIGDRFDKDQASRGADCRCLRQVLGRH